MPYYKFGPNDIFYNRIETHPQNDFLMWNGNVYYNYFPAHTGALSGLLENHVPVGDISLYELNVDRPADSMIYPFVIKDGSLTSFKTVSLKDFNSDFSYGDEITGTYPLNAGISREWATAFDALDPSCPFTICKRHLVALENTLNYYTYLSPHYAYSSSLGNKGFQEMGLIFVPSIFYGSHIEQGSVKLKFYVTGTLIGELQDKNRNGELIETTGPSTGSVAGVVLYTEGILLLTGSWDLSTSTAAYVPGDPAPHEPAWKYFGMTGSTSLAVNNVSASSFDMSFRGTNYVSVRTMLAQAPKGALNHSNNPTYLEFGQTGTLTPLSGSKQYSENANVNIKNTVFSSYADPTGTFQKQTWISRIGIYDEDMNLIGIAKPANPVKKTEDRSFTFKLKLDI